ncbi:hypothetical protein TNCV_447501 [Trichonephila clavipes]|nr:hypothetical protein TNCV_447501 [Trichonephila clavipes]
MFTLTVSKKLDSYEIDLQNAILHQISTSLFPLLLSFTIDTSLCLTQKEESIVVLPFAFSNRTSSIYHAEGHEDSPDKTRSYVQSKHCPDLQLTPNHILECPTVATKLLKMGMVPLRDSLREILYSPDAPRIAEAVMKNFDGI